MHPDRVAELYINRPRIESRIDALWARTLGSNGSGNSDSTRSLVHGLTSTCLTCLFNTSAQYRVESLVNVNNIASSSLCTVVMLSAVST